MHSIKKINMDNVDTEIDRFERAMETNINHYIVRGLMENYSAAIEYLSAHDDPRFTEMLVKVHAMLQNPQVIVMMQTAAANGSDVETETADAPSF